jgi:signal transduction histidine kinase
MEEATYTDYLNRIQELERQLQEANDTIDAIRSGQIDAIIVNDDTGAAIYTLQTADQAYRVFIEKMAEGALTLNTQGLIVYCNSKFASLVNQPMGKVIGSSFFDFIAPGAALLLQTLFHKGREHSVKVETVLSGSSHPVPVQLSINPLVIDGITSVNVIVTDLSVQIQHQEELTKKNELLLSLNEDLAKSNHDLQQFASIASHDLQEPLRKIQVFATFLREQNYEQLSKESKTHLEKIISASNRMKMLIVDILTYSRLSADEAYFESIALQDLIEEVVDDFDLKINEKKAVVTVGSLPRVQGNKAQLRQVFTNLVSNALKFISSEVEPRITIRSKDIDPRELGLSLDIDVEYCCVSVSDNGIGFDEKYANAIFSLFEKLNPKSAFEGTGIGLAIAKKIVDKHRGIITVKSEEGKGAEFNVILPLRQNHTDER